MRTHRISWRSTLRGTVSGFRANDCMDWAAALTYYGLLSLFPALLAMMSLVALVGDPETTAQGLLDIVGEVGPVGATDTLQEPVQQIAQVGRSSPLLFVAGMLGALWAASGYVGAFGRATNAIYQVDESRPFWKLRPLQMLLTLACVLLAAVAVIGLVVSGPLAQAVGESIGAGPLALSLWNVGKWPVIVIVVGVIVTSLYYAAPNVRQPRWARLSPGTALALVVWAVASAGFAFYVSQFGSYNATFGSLAAVVIFLVWLWLTNCAILLGAELNAALERERDVTTVSPLVKGPVREVDGLE